MILSSFDVFPPFLILRDLFELEGTIPGSRLLGLTQRLIPSVVYGKYKMLLYVDTLLT